MDAPLALKTIFIATFKLRQNILARSTFSRTSGSGKQTKNKNKKKMTKCGGVMDGL